MGYIIKGDFDTSYGKLQEIYVRIESFHFARQTGMCSFSYTYWPDKSLSDQHTPVYEGDKVSKAATMLDTQIIMYHGKENFTDILLPHSIKVFAGTVKTVEEPVYEYQKYLEEIPYISFNENGDEITKIRTVISEKKVLTGTTPVSKTVFDNTVVNNIQVFGYNKLKEVLAEWIDQKNIIQD